jgi:hypothetical protein
MKARLDLTGMLGFGLGCALAWAMGLGIGLRAQRMSEEQAQGQALEALSAQNADRVEAFLTWVTALRAQSHALFHGQETYTIPVLHWAAWEGAQAPLQAIRRLKASGIAPDAEERWLREVSAKAAGWSSTLAGGGFGILRARPEGPNTREWLGFVFSRPGGGFYSVAVIPQQAFPWVRRFSERSRGGLDRTYLIGADGSVLAHSMEDYAGAQFAQSRIFRDALQPALQGARKAGTGEFESIDQMRVRAAYARIGSLPLLWVTESGGGLRSGVLPPESSRVAGEVLFSWGLILLGMLGAGFYFGRRKGVTGAKAQAEAPVAIVASETPALAPPAERAPSLVPSSSPLPPISDSLGFGESTVRRDWLASQEALRSVEQEKKILTEIEEVLFQVHDPDHAVRCMTDGVARLTVGPTLFFQFQETLRLGNLRFESGFAPGQAPEGLSFPFSSEMIERLLQLASDPGDEARSAGKALLSEHEPLARIILARLGIAHFEAWPVYRYTALGRSAGKPRLHGVLVVLQAGEAAFTRQDSIGRVIRSAALVYENATQAR